MPDRRCTKLSGGHPSPWTLRASAAVVTVLVGAFLGASVASAQPLRRDRAIYKELQKKRAKQNRDRNNNRRSMGVHQRRGWKYKPSGSFGQFKWVPPASRPSKPPKSAQQYTRERCQAVRSWTKKGGDASGMKFALGMAVAYREVNNFNKMDDLARLRRYHSYCRFTRFEQWALLAMLHHGAGKKAPAPPAGLRLPRTHLYLRASPKERRRLFMTQAEHQRHGGKGIPIPPPPKYEAPKPNRDFRNRVRIPRGQRQRIDAYQQSSLLIVQCYTWGWQTIVPGKKHRKVKVRQRCRKRTLRDGGGTFDPIRLPGPLQAFRGPTPRGATMFEEIRTGLPREKPLTRWTHHRGPRWIKKLARDQKRLRQRPPRSLTRRPTAPVKMCKEVQVNQVNGKQTVTVREVPCKPGT